MSSGNHSELISDSTDQ